MLEHSSFARGFLTKPAADQPDSCGSEAVQSTEPLSLHDASRGNPNSKFVSELIQAGANPNAQDNNHWTPLHAAAYYGQEDCVDVLVRAKGIDLEARNKHGETPLHLCAKWPHDKAAEALCKGGADPNARNRRGRTPLHTAALFARRTVLEKLLAAGGNINSVDDDLATPLHLAVRPNSVIEMDLVMLIIRSGANLEAADMHGRCPISSLSKPQALVHFAASEGLVDLMGQLIARGCKVDDVNQDGLTPLQVAAMKGDLPMVNLLLANGARPNLQAAKGKTSDLTVGNAAGGVKLTTKQLVGDRTALHFAAEKGNTAVLAVLLAAGAKVNQQSEGGITALHLAVWHRHPEAVKTLLQAKADVQARVKTNGMTPLHYAAFNSHCSRDLVKLLLDNKADIEARTQEGWTPLHLAATVGPLAVVHELLSRGARISAKGRKGQTAIECARRRPEVTALLTTASASKRLLPALPPTSELQLQLQAAAAMGQGTSNSDASIYTMPPPLGGMSDPMLAHLPAAPVASQQQRSAAAGMDLLAAASSLGAAAAGAGSTSRSTTLASLSLSAAAVAAAAASPSCSSASATGSSKPALTAAAQALASAGSSALGSSTPHQALNSLLRTLQNYNVSVPGTLGAAGEGPPLPHLPPGTTHLARISATGPSAPALLAQLQEALSSAMKSHGLEACNSSLTVGENGQCSLQPSKVFGECRCLHASRPPPSPSPDGKDKEEKLLYMYCSNNCGFQFHATCWKLAKDRLKHLHPKFTGFSACRGDSSLLPCLSGSCNGVIDEVFMGTPQSCTELYRMNPPPHQQQGQGQGQGQKTQGTQQAAAPTGSGSSAGSGHGGQRSWQELLVRGDQLLKEMEEEEEVKGAHPQKGGQQQQQLGAAGALAVISSSRGLEAAAAAATAAGGQGKVGRAVAGLGTGLPAPPMSMRPAPPAPVVPPPVCDATVDIPSPMTSDPEDEAAAATRDRPTASAAVGKRAAKKRGKGGAAAGASVDLPAWLLEDMQAANSAANSAAAAKTKKGKQQQPTQQQVAAAVVAAGADGSGAGGRKSKQAPPASADGSRSGVAGEGPKGKEPQLVPATASASPALGAALSPALTSEQGSAGKKGKDLLAPGKKAGKQEAVAVAEPASTANGKKSKLEQQQQQAVADGSALASKRVKQQLAPETASASKVEPARRDSDGDAKRGAAAAGDPGQEQGGPVFGKKSAFSALAGVDEQGGRVVAAEQLARKPAQQLVAAAAADPKKKKKKAQPTGASTQQQGKAGGPAAAAAAAIQRVGEFATAARVSPTWPAPPPPPATPAPAAGKARQSAAAAAAVESLRSMLPGYSTKAVMEAIVAAEGDLNGAAELLLASGSPPAEKEEEPVPAAPTPRAQAAARLPVPVPAAAPQQQYTSSGPWAAAVAGLPIAAEPAGLPSVRHDSTQQGQQSAPAKTQLVATSSKVKQQQQQLQQAFASPPLPLPGMERQASLASADSSQSGHTTTSQVQIDLSLFTSRQEPQLPSMQLTQHLHAITPPPPQPPQSQQQLQQQQQQLRTPWLPHDLDNMVLPEQPIEQQQVLLPSSLLEDFSNSSSSTLPGAASTATMASGAAENTWQRTAAAAAAAWQVPVSAASQPGVVAAVCQSAAIALLPPAPSSLPPLPTEDGFDADWALLQEAMQQVAADSSSLKCMPTPQAFTAAGAAAAAAAAAEAALSSSGSSQASPAATMPSSLPVGPLILPGSQRLPSGMPPTGASPAQPTAMAASPLASNQPPNMFATGQQQQQQYRMPGMQQFPHQGMQHVRMQHAMTQMQQQQQLQRGQLSAEAMIGGALSEMKCTVGCATSRHLLLECPDIMLLAPTPAMIEAWMREHVGRFGSVACWRVLGPYGALALTLDSVHAAIAAAAGLNGATMLMRPLSAALLVDFPDDEQLVGHAQKVAMRSSGSSPYVDIPNMTQQLQLFLRGVR